MAEVLIEDAGGATISLMDYGGKTYRCLYFREETVRSCHFLPLRQDDVFLCSFPKAGCHWTWDIAQRLLDGQLTTSNNLLKEQTMIELVSHEEAESLASPRLLNTHMRFSELPPDLRKYRNKIIFVYRNVKDMAISHYHMNSTLASFKYDGKFDDYLSLYLSGNVDFGSPFDYLTDWDEVIKDNEFDMPIHLVSYEKLHTDTLAEIRRLSDFLEMEHTDEFLESVKEACSFQSMKESKGCHNTYADIYLGKNGDDGIFWKGKVGNWKKYFSVARNEEIDGLIRDKLSHVQFDFKYEI